MGRLGIILFIGIVLVWDVMISDVDADTSTQGDTSLIDQVIYVGLDNGEADPFNREENGASRFGILLSRQGARLKVLNWELPVPADADVVVLLSPTDSYSSAQIATLWTYISDGGNLLVVSDPTDSLSAASPLSELLWNAFGIGLENVILIDISSGEVALTNIAELLVQTDPHPVLQYVDFELYTPNQACSLRTEELVFNNVEVTPLVWTTRHYYGEANTRDFFRDLAFEFNIGEDLAPGSHIISAVAESHGNGTRVAVICDSDLILNRAGFLTSPPGSTRFLQPGAVQFSLNALYWLLDVEPPLLSFEAPAPTATPTITPSPTSSPTPESISEDD